MKIRTMRAARAESSLGVLEWYKFKEIVALTHLNPSTVRGHFHLLRRRGRIREEQVVTLRD